jgi:hypothetical protein
MHLLFPIPCSLLLELILDITPKLGKGEIFA